MWLAFSCEWYMRSEPNKKLGRYTRIRTSTESSAAMMAVVFLFTRPNQPWTGLLIALNRCHFQQDANFITRQNPLLSLQNDVIRPKAPRGGERRERALWPGYGLCARSVSMWLGH